MFRALRLEGHFVPLGDAGAMFPYLHPGEAARRRCGSRSSAWACWACCGPTWPPPTASRTSSYTWPHINMDRLAQVALQVGAFEDLGTYPPAVQDLAVMADRDVPAADVVAIARKAGGKLTRDVRVFDVYEGDQVPAGKRSLALRLVMRSPERTLSEKDITEVRRRVLQALERELGATLR